MRSVLIGTLASLALVACSSSDDDPPAAAGPGSRSAPASTTASATPSLPVLSSVGDGIACQRYDRAREAALGVIEAAQPDAARAAEQLETARVSLAAAAVSATDATLYVDMRRAAEAVSGITYAQGEADELAERAFEIVSKRVTDRCTARTTF